MNAGRKEASSVLGKRDQPEAGELENVVQKVVAAKAESRAVEEYSFNEKATKLKHLKKDDGDQVTTLN